jgi:natural resistance-associated macrophage protein
MSSAVGAFSERHSSPLARAAALIDADEEEEQLPHLQRSHSSRATQPRINEDEEEDGRRRRSSSLYDPDDAMQNQERRDGLSHAHHGNHPTEADVLPADDIAYDDMTRVHGEVQIPDVDERTLPLVEGDAASEEEGAHRPPFSWRLLWAYTGPGWLMSIAYLDPGNLESDLQAGAYTGYQLIWVLFWSTALGLLLQILAARLGVVTGKHLAQLCREQYRPAVSRALWLMTELAIIGSDIQQIIGSAIAFKILFGLPLWAGALITAADTFTFLGLHAFGVRKLEAFFAVLIGTMAVCFFINAGVVKPSATEIAKGFLPDVSDYAVVQAVSILGAVIMPHNIYLHSALVQSRAVDRNRPSKVREANFYFSVEAAGALAISFFINLAVVSVFARGFFDADCAKDGYALVTKDGVKECAHIGLQEAGEALKELLSGSASTIWAIGLLAAGQSSTMTGTFAGQYVMEGFLHLRIVAWKRVLLTRMIALVPAILVAVTSHADTNAHAGDTLDEYLNVLQSVQLPFALLPLLHFTSSRRIMGANFVNGRKMRWFLWIVVLGVMGVNMYLVGSEIFDVSQSGLPDQWWMYLILSILLAIYLFLVSVVVRNDVGYAWALAKRAWQRRRAAAAVDGVDAAGLLPAGDGAAEVEEELTLEEAYDQPEELSPAWYALQASATTSVTHRTPHSVAGQLQGSGELLAGSSDNKTPAGSSVAEITATRHYPQLHGSQE